MAAPKKVPSDKSTTLRSSPQGLRPEGKQVTKKGSTKTSKTTSKSEALDVKEESSKSNSLISSFNISKKTRYTVLGLILLGLLVYLTSKFLVVAWVDNKPITRFEYYGVMEKKYGNDTKENLIVEKLFMSEAAKRKVNVTDQEVQDEIKKVEERAGGGDALNQALQANGMTMDDLQQRIKLELLKQKLFGQGVNVSDEDLAKYIEENKQSLPETLTDNTSSESARMKEGLKEQLKQQKVDEDFNKWLQEALKSSRIIRS